MGRRYIWFLAAALLCGVELRSQGALGPAPPPNVRVAANDTPISRREHPRIWINLANRAEHYSKVVDDGHSAALFASLVSSAEADWSVPSRGFTFPTRAPIAYGYIYQMMVAGASAATTEATFKHTVAHDWCRRAADLILSYIAAFPTMDLEEQEYAITLYDWTFPCTTRSERVVWADWIRTSTTSGGLAYQGNPFPSNEVSKLNFRLIGGLAIANDGLTFTDGASADMWAQARIDEWDDYWRGETGVTRSRSFLSGDDGVAASGRSYEFGHTYMRMYRPEEAYRTAHGITKTAHYGGTSGLDDARVLRYIPQFLAYSILPWAPANDSYPGGRDWRIEKGHYMPAAATQVVGGMEMRTWVWMSAYAYDGVSEPVGELARWLVDNRIGDLGGSTGPATWHWFVERLLFVPATLPAPKSPATLGLRPSRVFNDGNIIFRQDWTSTNASYVNISAHKWLVDAYHSPYNTGSFQMFRNGPAIVMAGGAAGHDSCSGQNPGCNNSLRFTDRTITSAVYPDDMGGTRMSQRTPVTGSGSLTEDGGPDIRGRNDSSPELRTVDADASSRVAHYVYIDTTRSYQSDDVTDPGRTTKAVSAIRQFVYFPAVELSRDPDVLFVFDRATVKTGGNAIRLEWDVHTSGEPMVSGHSGTTSVARGSHTHTAYVGATTVAATNTVAGSNNATWINVLTPIVNVLKVWGPNQSGQPYRPDSHEFETPYGTNNVDLPVPPTADVTQYVTRGRVELHPRTHADTNQFLVCIEVAPSSTASQTPCTGGTSATMAYGRFGTSKGVAFPLASSTATSGQFSVTAAGTYKWFIGGLNPSSPRTFDPDGNCSIESAGAGAPHATSIDSQGTIELDVVATRACVIDVN